MAHDRKCSFWSWSHLAVILAATFLLVMLPIPGRSGRMPSFDERLILWAAFVAPWSTWLWYRFLRRGDSTDDAAERGPSPSARRLRFRACVWVVTAVLMAVGLAAAWSKAKARRDWQAATISQEPELRARFDPAERMLIMGDYLAATEQSLRRMTDKAEQTTPAERRNLQAAYEADLERIAARHHLSSAELKRLAAADIEGYVASHPLRPVRSAGGDKEQFTLMILLFDGLLILNMPIYSLLARFLGGWDALQSRLFYFLCALILGGEGALLICLVS